MDRRYFLRGAAAVGAALQSGRWPDAEAAEPLPTRDEFRAWMANRPPEPPKFVDERWDRFLACAQKKDIWGPRNIRGFLVTPRQEFVTKANLDRAYVWHFLDIGYGVTITGPHTVARMTSTLEIGPDEKVLEIGTGSGYQSAYLSTLTPNVWSIEIVPGLAARTRHLYDGLIARGYKEYAAIKTRNADGYYGWEEAAPFDKIIVTCGIDHVPPPLLRQLKPGGIMVIPVGPPGAQHVLKIAAKVGAGNAIEVARSDIYGGAIIPFVPFRQAENGRIVGTHNKGDR